MESVIKYFPQLVSDDSFRIKKDRLEKLYGLYSEWNEKINVISRKDITELYLHHVLHSLAILKTGLISDGHKVLDVGCGGGFPVVPLAIMLPDVEFTAIDSVGKKIRVVDAIVKELGLTNVKSINDRVENLTGCNYDWIVSRAVTSLPKFVSWTWDKTRLGILYLKGGDLDDEISSTAKDVVTYDIQNWFHEEYFTEKKVLYIKKC